MIDWGVCDSEAGNLDQKEWNSMPLERLPLPSMLSFPLYTYIYIFKSALRDFGQSAVSSRASRVRRSCNRKHLQWLW